MLANQLGNLILEQQFNISSNISKKIDDVYNHYSGLNNEEIVKWRAKILEYIGTVLTTNQPNDVWEQVTDWATQTAEAGIHYNLGVDELLKTIKVYRDVIWDYVEELNDQKIMLKHFLKINKIIDSILDHIAYNFSVTYVKHHDKVLKIAREASLEVSTPVVRITKNAAVVPLVGDIDTYRAKVLLEQSLKKSVELQISNLIIDLSGVPIVDTMVANELFRLAKSLGLIGVQAIFTGIRPEIAQAVINLGIDFKGIKTMKSLEQALTNIM